MIITTTIDTEHQQVVPKVLTNEMWEAGEVECVLGDDFKDAYEAALAAAPPAPSAWLPLRTAPTGEEVVALHNDGSTLVGAVRQSDGDWWWHHMFISEDYIEAWRPIGLPVIEQAGGKVGS